MFKSHQSLVVMINNGGEIQTRIVELNRFTIGRSIDATIPIPNSSVSRIHMTIAVSSGKIVLEDNGSANGTFLNAHRIPPKKTIEIQEFDTISIGNSNISIQFLLAEKIFDRSKFSGFRILFGSFAEKSAQRIIQEAEAEANRIIQHAHQLAAAKEQLHKSKMDEITLEVERKRESILENANIEAKKYLASVESQAKALFEQKKEEVTNYYRAKLEEVHAHVELEKEKLLREANEEKEKVQQLSSQILQEAQAQANNIILNAEKVVTEKVNEFLSEAKAQNELDRAQYWKDLDSKFSRERERELIEFEQIKLDHTQQIEQLKSELSSLYLQIDQIKKEQAQLLDSKERISQELDALELRREAQNVILRKIENDIKVSNERLAEINALYSSVQGEYEKVDSLLEDRRLEIERSLELLNKHNQSVEVANLERLKALEELNQIQFKLKTIKSDYIEKSREIEDKLESEKKYLTRELELYRDKISTEKQALAQEYQLEIESLSKEKEVLTTKKSKLLLDLDELALEIHKNQNALDVIKQDQRQTQHELEMNLKAFADLIESKNKIEGEVSVLNKSKADLEDQVTNLTNHLRILNDELLSLNESHKQISLIVSELDQQKVSIEKELNQQRDEKISLQREIETLREQFDIFQSQIGQKKAELEQLITQYSHSSFEMKEKLEREYRQEQEELRKAIEARELTELKRINQLVDQKIAEFNARREQVSKSLHYQIESMLVSKVEPIVFEEISEKLRMTIDNMLVENFAGASIEQLQDQNIKVGRYFSARFTYTLTATSLILGLSVLPVINFITQQINGTTYKERLDAKIQKQKLEYEARRFRPPQVSEWQDSYVDLVIYTEGFTKNYQDENYIKSLNRKLMHYMFSTYRIDEAITVQAIAKILSLVSELDKKFQNIHPDFVEENLEKMRELEASTLQEVESLLGSKVRVEALFKAQRRHFESYGKLNRMAN